MIGTRAAPTLFTSGLRIAAGNVRLLSWSLAALLGALHALAAARAYSMNEDGINYLDMGDAFMRGDWGSAVNAVWSPLYPLLLGAVMQVVNPSPRWEFPTAHLFNFAVYLGALACFEYFWRQLMRHMAAEAGVEGDIALPDRVWLALGYALFIWSALGLTRIWSVTPDMLMAALVYLAAGTVVQIRGRRSTWRSQALLGVVLGLAYLAKAIMFPLGLVFLVVGALAIGDLRRAAPRLLVGLVFFFLVAGPFVAAISEARGRLTFGDAGSITYLRYVNGVPYPHWQGEGSEVGTPAHPSRKILDSPAIYEFAGPVGGTYPISYDPYYWYEGARTSVDVAQQSRVLLAGALVYYRLFFEQQGALVGIVALLYLVAFLARGRARQLVGYWPLIVPCLIAFAAYALVYVEGRYLGPFVVILWGCLLAGIRLPDTPLYRSLARGAGMLALLAVLASILALNLEGFGRLQSRLVQAQPTAAQAEGPTWPGQTAEELRSLGIEPGDHVAVIGEGFTSFWARLGRVKIVAEMPAPRTPHRSMPATTLCGRRPSTPSGRPEREPSSRRTCRVRLRWPDGIGWATAATT